MDREKTKNSMQERNYIKVYSIVSSGECCSLFLLEFQDPTYYQTVQHTQTDEQGSCRFTQSSVNSIHTYINVQQYFFLNHRNFSLSR